MNIMELSPLGYGREITNPAVVAALSGAVVRNAAKLKNGIAKNIPLGFDAGKIPLGMYVIYDGGKEYELTYFNIGGTSAVLTRVK
jgi:hypothetical protein